MKRTPIISNLFVLIILFLQISIPICNSNNPILFSSSSADTTGFTIEIIPPDHPMLPGKNYTEIEGFHQYVGGPIAQLFPHVWFWHYTTVKVKVKPDWVRVILPAATLLSNPDGRKENFSIFIGIKEDAPENSVGLFILEFKTGLFIREALNTSVLLSKSKLFNEVSHVIEIPVQTGTWIKSTDDLN
jgi:hypothetical protein